MIQLTTEEHEVIQSVIDYDMDAVVDAYAVSQGLSLAQAKEQETELKRYLALRVVFQEERLGMAGPVDELWHYFILATWEYRAFCDYVGHFVHHRPRSLDEVETAGDRAYERTLRYYAQIYGEPAPAEMWPTVQMLAAVGSGADCGRCT